MPVKQNDPTEVPEAEQDKNTFTPEDHTGFHVMRGDGQHLGTYETEEDAQAFIDGHLVPQEISASIVEGHDREPAPAAA